MGNVRRKRVIIWIAIAVIAVSAAFIAYDRIRAALHVIPTPHPTTTVLRDQWKNIKHPPGNTDVRFAVFGDIHKGYDVLEKIISEVEKDGKYEFMMCVGDTVNERTDEEMNRVVKSFLANLKKTPLCFIPGNHDVSTDDDTTRAFYEAYYGTTHYSFAVGNTLFVEMDNATDAVFPEEYEWLDNLLKSERDKHENLIVFMHKPPRYVNYRGQTVYPMGEGNYMKLMPLLKKYRATAIFCGHWHDYSAYDIDGVQTYMVQRVGGKYFVRAEYSYLEVNIHDGKAAVTVHEITP